MKKVLFFLLFFTLTRVYGQNTAINLIPQPVEIQQSAGAYILTNTSAIGYDSQESRKTAEMFAQKLNVPTGFSIKAQQIKTGAIQFNLNKTPVAKLG